MSPEDPWEWPFLMYIGTVVLRRTEKAFWRMTPRKLTALAKVHGDVNNPEGRDKSKGKGNEPKVAYIDQVM